MNLFIEVFINQKQGFLIPLHPLIDFEIKKNYQNEPRFNGVCSSDNIPEKSKQ